MQSKWTAGEREVLRQFYNTEFWPDVRRLFAHRTPGAIAWMAHQLGVSRKEKRWTMKERAELVQDYQTFTPAELVAKYGVSYHAVRRRAYVLGVRKKV